MNQKVRNAAPKASVMLEALRGLGYSTAAALADIIDNSVSAGASEVEINFQWHGINSRVSILDNGCGMEDATLEGAMRLGARSPLEVRATSDLGRFGMGLKTASLSQCRRLTVASVVAGTMACLRWDLDALAANAQEGQEEWLLFEGPSTGSEDQLVALADRKNGTLVLWEVLDRIVTTGYGADDFVDLIDRVDRHLGMIFHRLLQGPRERLRILINGRAVAPWDPFMSGHPAKPWNSPVERRKTSDGLIAVECHVLPHKDKLSAREHELAAGPEGWNAQQGIYVYRNERLLVSGGWLGLGQGRSWHREESFRLARIRLDIPNTADAAWKIDIRKSTARPPVSLRPWLTALAEDTRARARSVFAYRGAPLPRPGSQPIEQAWRVEHARTGVRYRIDEGHPAVAAVLEVSADRLQLVRAMLKLIEATVPIQRIWLDTAENKDTATTGFVDEPSEAVSEVIRTLFDDMVGRRGMSEEAAKKLLMRMEPFQNFPKLVESISDNK